MEDDTDDLLEQLRTRHIKLGYELPTESLFSAAADEIERLNDEIDRLREENERLREAWMMEKQVGVRAFEKMCELAKALQKIAQHPTGGVGCNPVVFVKEARAALAEKEST